MKTRKYDRKKMKKIALVTTIGIVALLVIFGIYTLAYSSRAYPHQALGDLKFGGYHKQDLTRLIQSEADEAKASTVILISVDNGKEYPISPIEIGLNYDVAATVDKVWQSGRNRNVFVAIGEQISSIFRKKTHQAIYTFDADILKQKVVAISAELDKPERDYSFAYNGDSFVLNSDRIPGQRIDQTEIIEGVKSQISSLKLASINFAMKSYSPQVSDESANKALLDANKMLTTGNLTLNIDSSTYTIDRDTIGGLIVSKANGRDLNLTINTERATAYVAELAKSVDVAPQNAKLAVADNKVSIFQVSRIGKSLDQGKTVTDITNALFARVNDGKSNFDPLVINLAVKTTPPEISSDSIADYGLVELVGTSTTSFIGSPSNRVHNITVGAAAINGVLLKPGEEFSTLAHLGQIDASAGYLEELVIKDNKTLPEFGGGLCQVSSTLFRAALNAGMKITERANHSYRVSYYEPPVGMDATIYDPAPDFKFINNYSSYILVQSKVVGTKITFDFYGTKDGRTVEATTPEVTSYVEPPAPIIVVSDSLQPGERRQTSKSHQGATAVFNYKVTATDGVVLQERNFKSVYNAIPEQWIVGPDAPAPTSTCADGVQNGDETGVDVGGSCPA